MAQIRNQLELIQRADELIGPELERVEQLYADELTSRQPYIRDIAAHTNRFRGKRMRPILCLLSAQAVGSVRDETITLAAVIEMIHTATLVHDDVLDEADVRRHVSTVNVRWNNETSVLYGDYLFTHAFHLCAATGSAAACRIVGRATNRVCEGELTQVRNRGNLELTEAEYFDIIDGKTAELFAVACELGATFGQSETAHVDALERYGRQLGLAFQIIDDILDIAGVESTVGKTLGTDLKQQKLTLPLIHLLATSTGEQRDRVVSLLEEASPEAGRQLTSIARESGSIDHAIARAKQLIEEARTALATLPTSPAREILDDLAQLAIDRAC